MQTHSTTKSSEPSKPPPFLSVQPQREPAFFSQSELQMPDVVQRKCATCEEKDDKLQRQVAIDDVRHEVGAPHGEAAHRVGFKTTGTIMFGHVDRYDHWARHLLRIRSLLHFHHKRKQDVFQLPDQLPLTR